MTKNIYILIGGVSHEGSHIIAAFNSQQEAERLAEKCREYDKLEPVYPQVPAYPPVLTDAHLEWYKAKDVWEDNHPSGSAYYDYYEVEEVELK